MSEWKYFSLEELVFVDKEQLSNSTESDFMFYYIDISCVSTDTINFPNTPITFNESPSRARKVLHNGDVLMATVRPNLKAFAKFIRPSKSNFIASTGFAVLSKKESADLDFIYHSLFSYAVEKQIETLVVGSNYPALNTSDIRKLRIFTPDLLTQRHIAKILTTADAVIEKTQAAIDKYKAIKQGMLHDLFTRGIDISTGKLRPKYEDTPELYKESKLGMIPKEWDAKKIENLAKVNGRVGWKGYTVSDLRETGPLALGAAAIDKENKLDLSKPIHLSMEKYLESPEIMVQFGDILIVQRGTIGKIVIIDKEIGEATINPSMVLLNNIRTNNFFLYYQLCSFIGQRQIELLTSQTGVPMISQQQLNSINIAIPKVEKESNAIGERIRAIDKKLYNEIDQLQKLQKIKNGLMGDLLSGKKRVTVKEEEMA